MSALRRLAFVVGCLPLFACLGILWIITERDPLEGMDKFEKWALR